MHVIHVIVAEDDAPYTLCFPERETLVDRLMRALEKTEVAICEAKSARMRAKQALMSADVALVEAELARESAERAYRLVQTQSRSVRRALNIATDALTDLDAQVPHLEERE